jgi:hypothetical protein
MNIIKNETRIESNETDFKDVGLRMLYFDNINEVLIV